MITEQEIKASLERLLKLEEIDRTSYQAGINHETNLNLVAHELYQKLYPKGQEKDWANEGLKKPKGY